jgi:hypothetical protein
VQPTRHVTCTFKYNGRVSLGRPVRLCMLDGFLNVLIRARRSHPCFHFTAFYRSMDDGERERTGGGAPPRSVTVLYATVITCNLSIRPSIRLTARLAQYTRGALTSRC